MSNDMTGKQPFDYAMVSQEQAMQLRTISTRLAVRVQRTAEEMLAMGADLREAKQVCKEEGTLFTAWCESAECPVGVLTAQRLMSIHDRLGNENTSDGVFQNGLAVLSEVTMTRDEDIRQALIEHLKAWGLPGVHQSTLSRTPRAGPPARITARPKRLILSFWTTFQNRLRPCWTPVAGSGGSHENGAT